MMPFFNRRAEWIWRPRGINQNAPSPSAPFADETNRFVYFRKTIKVAQTPTHVPVHVSADGRYQLFVNGKFVGRGPARCDPLWQCVDEYDIAPHLVVGRNVIAALAHSYGRHTAWYELPPPEHARAFGCGGFFLQGNVGDQRIDTDASWRCLVSEAWQRAVPSSSLGFNEIYDARRAPMNWSSVGFDDSTWDVSEVLRGRGHNTNADVIPFPVLIPRAIPHLSEQLRLPASIVAYGEVRQENILPDVVAQLTREKIEPLQGCVVQPIEQLLKPGGEIEIVTTNDHAVAIVVDFGSIVNGYIHLDIEGDAGAIIDLVFDERLQEDNRVHISEGIPRFDSKMAHRYILREGRQVWERFEWNGARYLQATFRGAMRVHSLAVNTVNYPTTMRGSFECSDEVLNRIWQAGVRTLQLCMNDAYMDCPSREQREWMGDAYLEALINYVSFGDTQLIAQTLRHIAQSQQANGLTMPAAPSDFAATATFNIPDFCLYWMMAIHQYVEYTGDESIVHELYSSVVKAIAWFEQFLNADDLLTDVPHWVFIDWAELDKKGQVTALNAQFVAALRAAANLANILQAPLDAGRFDALAARVATAINARLWDEARGVYVDAFHSRRVSQHANASVIAFNIAPVERWEHVLDYVMDDARLVLTRGLGEDKLPSPAFDEERNVVLAQPFYMHWVHQALRRANKYETIIDNIRRRWNAMLTDSNATFWEAWTLVPMTSMCHAFSATPTFDLSIDGLGITPLEPGFKRFRVAPSFANLDWARGTFPTPHGDIQVEWKRTGAEIEMALNVPGGTEAHVQLLHSKSVVAQAGIHRFAINLNQAGESPKEQE